MTKCKQIVGSAKNKNEFLFAWNVKNTKNKLWNFEHKIGSYEIKFSDETVLDALMYAYVYIYIWVTWIYLLIA